jgi:hypothetical protein
MLKALGCFSSLSEPSRCAGSFRRGKVKDRIQVLLDEHGIAVRIGPKQNPAPRHRTRMLKAFEYSASLAGGV